MTTILTFKDIERLFYIYNTNNTLMSFEETYELFDDLGCLNEISKDNFIELYKSYKSNTNNTMDLNEIYNLYQDIMKLNNKW